MHETLAKGILSNENGMNIYRGCTHGCIYCDTRSAVYGFTHDFEDVEIKTNAPQLLEKALKSKREPCMISTGSMTDPYIPIEAGYRLTRKCLEVIERYGFGADILTKSDRVLEDIDLIERINNKSKAVVEVTLTTMDDELCRIIEPYVSVTSKRIEVLKECQKRGIPTVVWLSPILPFINDNKENITGIIDVCQKTGVKGIICFGMGLTLRDGNREYFYKKLDENFAGLKEKYIKTYGNSYECQSKENYELMKLFREKCREYDILHTPEDCFRYLREFPIKEEQVSLF